MMQFLDPTVLLGIAVAALFVCVLLLLRHIEKSNAAFSAQMTSLRKDNAALQEKLSKQLAQSQEESRANAEAMSAAVSRALTEMARTQQMQLDDFARKAAEHRRTQDEQLDGVIATLVNAVSRMQENQK